MRRLLPYVATLLVYLMTPAAGEVIENVAHLLIEGHTAHAFDDDAHRAEGAEHCCSGPFHLCLCHASAPFTPASVTADVVASLAADETLVARLEQPRAEGSRQKVYRPPIS